MPYLIKEKTNALIPQGKTTKILEHNKEIIINESIHSIIEQNCCRNGSNLDGRRKGSAYLIGSNYKPPIIIDEIKRIILIPTHSHRNIKCQWIVLGSILKYKISNDQQVIVTFKDNHQLILDINFHQFDKQVLRATRLESALRGRNYQKHL